MESVPTVNIDKTDGCQVYLSKECRSADIVMAKSSEMNVMIPQDDGDFVRMHTHTHSHVSEKMTLKRRAPPWYTECFFSPTPPPGLSFQ